MFAHKYTAKFLSPYRGPFNRKKIYVTKLTSKIEPISQITHFDTPPRRRFFEGDWLKTVIFHKLPAFDTSCILSELGNALNSCHFNSSFISFTVITSIATHCMPAPHTVCYSGKQVGLRQLQLIFTGNSIHRARGDCSH